MPVFLTVELNVIACCFVVVTKKLLSMRTFLVFYVTLKSFVYAEKIQAICLKIFHSRKIINASTVVNWLLSLLVWSIPPGMDAYLNPMDFSLWGLVKNIVYADKITDLRHSINGPSGVIATPGMIDSTRAKIDYCIDVCREKVVFIWHLWTLFFSGVTLRTLSTLRKSAIYVI